MVFPFTQEHEIIRDSAKGWLQDWYNGGRALADMNEAKRIQIPDIWSDFAGTQGFAAIAIEEQYGGAGLGALGRALIMEEMGYVLLSSPFFSTCCLVAELMAQFADADSKKKYLPKIAAAQTIIGFADGRENMHVKNNKLNGTLNAVLDMTHADAIMLALSRGDVVELYHCPLVSEGIAITPHMTLDPLRDMAMLTFSNFDMAHAAQIGSAPHQEFARALCIAQADLVFESIGAAQHCLDMVLTYSDQRVQFGHKIASFQAIKHRCADMYVALESARSAAYYAASADAAEKLDAALIARGWCHDAFFKIAGDAIQLHGGIGFTWDYPLHYFFKRARANRALYGFPKQDYEQLALHIGLGAA